MEADSVSWGNSEMPDPTVGFMGGSDICFYGGIQFHGRAYCN